MSIVGDAPTVPIGTCVVLEVGDSLGNDLGWGIAHHLAPASGLDMVQDDESATGLANSSFLNWPAQLAYDLQQTHPQLVLISVGGNDEQAIDDNGTSLQFSSSAWQTAYEARARDMVNEATAAGAYVMWVGMPIMQQPAFSAGMKVLNSLDQQAAQSDPDATFLSVWQLFANPQGQFQSAAQVNGSPATLRQSDGVHYSLAGEDVIATYVLGQLAAKFHVVLTPTDPVVITGWS